MAHFIVISILVVAAVPVALAGIVLGAVFPFFLLGLAGQLWWKWQRRGERPGGENANVYFFEEKQLWSSESKSLAETLDPPSVTWREAG